MPPETPDHMLERGFPSQDPSALTTAQLLREISSLKDVLGVRLDAIEKASDVFAENISRVPTSTQQAVGTLRELVEARFSEVYTTIEAKAALTNEKLDGIYEQFALRDKAVKETSDLNATALQAALAAAEKSAQKTNDSFVISAEKTAASFTKTQDAQAAAVSALSNALSDKLNDQKERITAIESRSGGIGQAWGWVAGGIGLLFSFITVAIAILVFLSHSNTAAVAPIVIPK